MFHDALSDKYRGREEAPGLDEGFSSDGEKISISFGGGAPHQ